MIKINLLNTSKLSVDEFNKISQEIHSIIKSGWGDFGIDYVKNHILTSDYVVLATSQHKIVAFASARVFSIRKKPVFYLEFTAVEPSFQSRGLSKKMNGYIFRRIIASQLKKIKFSFEVVTISPNPIVLGSIVRTADFTVPSPYNEKTTPAFIKEIISNVLEQIGDPYVFYDIDYNVIEGFYEEGSELIYKIDSVPRDSDDRINNFASEKLKFSDKKGREFVIYARYSLLNLIIKSLTI